VKKKGFIVVRISGQLIDEKREKQLAFFLDRNLLYRSRGGSELSLLTDKLCKHDLSLKEIPILVKLSFTDSTANPLHINP
jgi:hypothetical protein